MLESRPSSTSIQRAAAEKEAIKAISAVLSAVHKYLVAYIKMHDHKPLSRVYRELYPNAIRAPSQTKFYKDVKNAGSVPAYLTHHFYRNFKSSLETLGLPPHKVSSLLRQTEDGRRYWFGLQDAKKLAPSQAELQVAGTIQPRPRRFRHHPKSFPDVLLGRSIRDFFTEMHRKNESFYKARPDQLFKLTALAYEDYLQSPFWFVIRNIVLFRDSFECAVCRAKATSVHHHRYDVDVLYGKDLSALVSLCDPCHKLIEFDEIGKKVTNLNQKRRKYEALKKGYL